MHKEIPSEMDNKNLVLMRDSISIFLHECLKEIQLGNKNILEVGPANQEIIKEYLAESSTLHTLDIDKDSECTYIADITQNNEDMIPSEFYDVVICTEVLEHTLNPFNATNELRRILKKGGILLVTTPYNFRIHGPIPDCWRFTIHGLQELFKNFKVVEVTETPTPNRPLMPINYLCKIVK